MQINLGGLEDLIPPVAQWLGLEPSSLLLFIGILVIVARIAARAIPDNKTGVLAVIRRIASIVAVDVGNRIAPGLTVTDVAKAVIARKVTEMASDVGSDARSILRDQLPDLDPKKND